MKSLYLSGARALSIAVLSFGLVACGGEEEIAKTFDPVAFHPDDECHVCGMIIEEYPGPKGQAGGGHMGLGIFIAQTLLEKTGATVRYANNPPDSSTPPADQTAGGHSNQGGTGARISVRWKTINAKK